MDCNSEKTLYESSSQFQNQEEQYKIAMQRITRLEENLTVRCIILDAVYQEKTKVDKL